MAIPQGKSIRPANTATWFPPLPDAPGFEHFIVDTLGLHTHVATIGEGPPVVMLHGFPQHWWQWRNIAPTVAAAGYQVFCPDLRGAGWTVADDPYIVRETRMRDVLAIFKALQLEQVHLVSHVIVGAGPTGRATARYLHDRGHQVILASRSGTGPEVTGVQRVSIDATDATALIRLAHGATAIYNCMNPTSYTRWAEEWPPLHNALLQAAQATGAVLVTLSNLYMYGPMRNGSPITADTLEAPQDTKGDIRARMDRESIQAYREGALRAVVVRASDFIGPELGDNGHATRNIPAIAAGRTVHVLGRSDQPHSWTNIDDVAATLATVALQDETHGRIWFAPTNPPVSQRELSAELAQALDRPVPQVASMPQRLLKMLGLVSPTLRELHSVSYQFTDPWVIDSTATTQALGLRPTAWDQVVREAAYGNVSQASPKVIGS